MADLAALLAEVKGALQRMEKAREDYETGAHLTKTQQDEIDLWRQLRAAEDAIKHASPEWLGALVQAVEDQQRELDQLRGRRDKEGSEGSQSETSANRPQHVAPAWLLQATAASESSAVSRDVLRHFLGVTLKELAYRTKHERVVVAADTEAIVNLRSEVAQLRADGQRLRQSLDDAAITMRNYYRGAISRAAVDEKIVLIRAALAWWDAH